MTQIPKEKESEKKFRKTYEFFKKHYANKKSFQMEELQNYVEYSNPETFDTYFSKNLRDLVIKDPSEPESLYVRDNFKLYSRYHNFRNLISQRSVIVAKYKKVTYDKVLIYEFYMPMTNERILRACLDNLFYLDTLMFRLKTIPMEELKKYFNKKSEPKEKYLKDICRWISDKFSGYSIETVSGRFRAGKTLMSFSEAGKLLSRGEDYLIDETTAIVRFIFPIDPPITIENEYRIDHFAEKNHNKEIARLWFVFENIFLESILEVINGEDQIWMIERGINQNKLHIWEVESSDSF